MLLAFKKTLTHLFHPGRSNNHRPRLLHLEALVILTIFVAGFGGLLYAERHYDTPLGDILGYASNISPDDVIRQTNEQRARLGLQPLAYNGVLSAAAAAKGQDMFANQYWAHTSPTGKEPWDFMSESGYTYRVAGENLARDFMNTSTMVDAWMASPTHKANVVNSRYTEIGVAVINGHLQGTDTTLVVQMFGTPRTAVAAVPTTNQVAQVQATPVPVVQGTNQEGTSPDPVAPSETQPNEEEFVSVDLSGLGNDEAGNTPPPTILAQVLVPIGEINPHILFSPVELAKAFSLAVSLMLVFVLTYDLYLSHKRNTVRVVGKNLGHILLFLTVIFLLIFLKGGLVG